MGFMDIFTRPQQAVQDMATDVANNVTGAGGNFLTNLISSPVRAISGAVSGAFGSLWNGVKYFAISLGLQTLGAPVYNAGYKAIFGEEAYAKLLARRGENALGTLVVDAAKQGFGAAAVIGGAGGAMDAVGGGLVSKALALTFIGGAAVVTIGALHKNDVKIADNGGNTTLPPTTPGSKPKPEQAKG